MSTQTLPGLLPPGENPLGDDRPKIKLWHFPVAMVYLGTTLGILGVFITVAVLFGAALTIAFFIAIAGVLLIGFPSLFWIEYRKRRADRHTTEDARG